MVYTIIMGHCGGDVYVLLMVHSRWTEIAWQPRDTIGVHAATVANLTVACGVGQGEDDRPSWAHTTVLGNIRREVVQGVSRSQAGLQGDS